MPRVRPARERWSTAVRWTGALFLGVACLIAYRANGLVLEEIDAIPTPYVAWSILEHGDLGLDRFPEIHRFPRVVRPTERGRVSKYPPGVGMSAAAFVAPMTAGRETPPTYGEMREIGKWVGASFSAATVGLFYLWASRVAAIGALPAAIVLGLGTTLFSTAGQAGWAHGPATFWGLLGFFLVWKVQASPANRDWLLLVAGLAFSMAILTRPMVALMLAAAGLAQVVDHRWRGLALLLLGSAPGALATAAYQSYWFESAVIGGYTLDASEGGLTNAYPLGGFFGLLFSPSRGLFVFTPAFLVALAGLPTAFGWCRREAGPALHVLAALLLSAGAQLLLSATWRGWVGGWTWGPRLLTESLPAWAMLMAVGYERWATSWPKRAIAALLIALSIGIHAIGVTPRYGYQQWHARHADNLRDAAWDVDDMLIEAQLEERPPPSQSR
jgi:hypothetical protein